MTDLFSSFLAFVVICTAGILLVYSLHFLVPNRTVSRSMRVPVARFVWWIGLAFSTAIAIGTLIYSELIGYPPCELCWFQRIALYPQIVLFAVGLWRPASALLVSAFTLSLAGAAFAVASIVVQLQGSTGFVCGAGGSSCSSIHVLEFGFITMPVMALVGFWLLMTVSATALLAWRRREEQ